MDEYDEFSDPRSIATAEQFKSAVLNGSLVINSEMLLKVIGGPQPAPFLKEPEPPCHD
jgi:hypothetical protein